jgi:hypothetical protein
MIMNRIVLSRMICWVVVPIVTDFSVRLFNNTTNERTRSGQMFRAQPWKFSPARNLPEKAAVLRRFFKARSRLLIFAVFAVARRSSRPRRWLQGSPFSDPRRIMPELRKRRIHLIPRLCVRSEDVHLRTKPTGVIQAARIDSDDSGCAFGILSARQTRAAVSAKTTLVLTDGRALRKMVVWRATRKFE